ncbi:Hypothetical predicted protein [Mytilus galloprovincialis]|uniref:B box-type domain-containing protein n=1 Tax=Mytilus galloprovincialis TaxID=29158 RepID=A0A8B6FHD6_MYTGA|nr:Hypothetical predicted protein [Mytilus galloprovincialis]
MPNEKLCAGCLRDNEENIAETWCSNCSELVCKFCAKVHRRFDPPHKIVQLNDVSENNFSLIETSKYCGTHSDQKSVLYCSQHDKSICDLCLSGDHANCQAIVSIERAAKGAKEGSAADDLEKRLKDIVTVARTSLKEVKTNADSLIKQKSDILQMVSTVRKEIEKHLDELEQDITEEIEKQYNTCQQRVMEQKIVMEKQEKELMDRNADINSLKLCTNDIQFFQTIKTLDVSTHQYETAMTTNITRISLEYEPNEEIPKLVAALKTFGNIRLSETDLELHHIPDKMQQSQVQVKNTKDTKSNGRTGHWSGFYKQHDRQHPFELDIVFMEGNVTGEGIDQIGKFTIAGTCDVSSRRIQFRKQYKGAHSVNYSGQLSQDGCKMEGQYNIGGSSDKFTMTFVPAYHAVSGHWTGFYNQNGNRYAFELDIAFEGDKVSGEGDDGIGKFSINGDWISSSGKIQFCKQYHGKHSVDYSGQLSCDGRSMKGKYNVSGFSDNFTMTVVSL